jgi:hypothetical protein
MSRRGWIMIGVLGALFAGLLVYGVLAGDAAYVFDNARHFCST